MPEKRLSLVCHRALKCSSAGCTPLKTVKALATDTAAADGRRLQEYFMAGMQNHIKALPGSHTAPIRIKWD